MFGRSPLDALRSMVPPCTTGSRPEIGAPLSKRCSFGLSAFRAGNGDPSQARGGGQKINSRLRNCPMELFADKLCLRPN